MSCALPFVGSVLLSEPHTTRCCTNSTEQIHDTHEIAFLWMRCAVWGGTKRLSEVMGGGPCLVASWLDFFSVVPDGQITFATH